jgi:hypothetical protein
MTEREAIIKLAEALERARNVPYPVWSAASEILDALRATEVSAADANHTDVISKPLCNECTADTECHACRAGRRAAEMADVDQVAAKARKMREGGER